MKTKKKSTGRNHSLQFDNVQPSLVVNHEFIPISPTTPATVIESAEGQGVIEPVKGSGAFVADVDAFGETGLKASTAVLGDEVRNSVIDIAKNGFTLGQILQNFVCEDQSLFVFDDVKIIVKQKPTGNSMIFSGVLRMDQQPMQAFARYLNLSGGVLFGAEIDLEGQNIGDKIAVTELTLTSAAVFHLNLIDGMALNGLQLKLTIEPKKKNNWTITPQLAGDLIVSGLADGDAVFACNVDYADKTLRGQATLAQLDGLFGLDNLSLSDLSVRFGAGQTSNFALSAKLNTKSREYGFAGVINQTYIGLATEVSGFDLKELSKLFAAVAPGKLALPDYDAKFTDVTFSLATADCTVAGKKIGRGVGLSGDFSLFDTKAKATAQLSAQGIAFSGELQDLTIGPVVINDARLQFSLFSQQSKRPTELAISGDTHIEGMDVKAKLAYEKQNGAYSAVLYGELDAASFGLSSIVPQAKGTFVDTLQFSKVAFIYSTNDAATEDPDFAFRVRKGMQLMGVLQEIPALFDITGSKHIGLELAAYFGKVVNISIAVPNSGLHLGPSVICDPFRLGIDILPSPALDMVFGCAVRVPKQDQPLHFDLKLELGMMEAAGSGTMKGYWEDPFGAKGLRIGPNLALELGIIYQQFVATGIPSAFGFAGGLQLGDVVAQMAVKISEVPSEEILYGELDELSPANLVKFVEGVANISIPGQDVPNFFELKQLKLYCAPTGGSIGTISYEPGFSFAGDLILFNKQIAAYARVSDEGAVIKGHLDRMAIGPLKIHGEKGGDARLDLELTAARQSILIDGEIEFLSSNIGAYVDISNRGIEFDFDQSFMGIINYTIAGKSSGSLDNPAALDFMLSSEFDSKLTAYLKNDLSNKLQIAIDQAQTDIGTAQANVSKAQQAYENEFGKAEAALTKARSDADAYLQKCREAVKDEQDQYNQSLNNAKKRVEVAKGGYERALTQARNALTKAQTDYDQAMRSAQNAVSQAQTAYSNAMKKAQNDVGNAQRAYEGAFNDASKKVQGAKRQVNSILSELNAAKNELKHLPWNKAYKAPYLSSKIAALGTAYGTTYAGLTAAEGVLKAVQQGGKYAAFESAKKTLEAVRYGGQYGALEAAKKSLELTRIGVEYGALEAAKQSLALVKQGSEYTTWRAAEQSLNAVQTTGSAALTAAEKTLASIGTSAVYLALEAAKRNLDIVKHGSSAIAFESAKAALEAAKQGSTAMLGLAKLAASHAGDLIDIRQVRLSGSLKAIERGQLFQAEVDMSVLSKDAGGSFELDVRQPAVFVESLFVQALNEAKALVTA
ncbi:hypothetical protein [Methylomonas sp. MgM2]